MDVLTGTSLVRIFSVFININSVVILSSSPRLVLQATFLRDFLFSHILRLFN